MVNQSSLILGWEEWVALPALGLPSIKAKVDTGAKTSAIHAHDIEPFGPASAPMVRFVVNPVPSRNDITVVCSAPVVGQREVISSNGDREVRFVIETPVSIAGREWPIELTLTNRASMTFRMLLGRRAIRDDIFVDPMSSFRQPRLSYKPYRRMPRRDLVRRPLRIGILTRRPEAASVEKLRDAAGQRGHVVDRLQLDDIAVSFDGGKPGITVRGKPGPHYDAIIPRVGLRGDPLAAVAVRQLELMGCYAVNSGDALDRVREPLAVLQELSRAGLPIDTGAGPTDLAASDAAGPPPAVTLCAIVVGGRVVVTVRRRQGRTTMPARKVAPAVTNLAAKAAGVLRLGLAAVDILRDPDRPEPAAITAVSAVPDLSRIERISGVDVAREIVDLIEQRVRSRVTAVDLAE